MKSTGPKNKLVLRQVVLGLVGLGLGFIKASDDHQLMSDGG